MPGLEHLPIQGQRLPQQHRSVGVAAKAVQPSKPSVITIAIAATTEQIQASPESTFA